MRFRTVLARSFRRLCPVCGKDRIFTGLARVKERCGSCGLDCRPEGGYYLGAIYINFGITSLLALGIGFFFAIRDELTAGFITAGAVAAVFPVAFFQISRSLWLGIDTWISRHVEP
jgi:hypothetical protein